MGKRSSGLLVPGLLVALLCVLVTASGEGLTWDRGDPPTAGVEEPDRPAPEADPLDSATPDDEEPDEGGDQPPRATWTVSGRLAALVLLVALALVLVAVLVHLRLAVRRRDPRPARRPGPDLPPPAGDDVPDDTEVAEALGAGIDALGRGSARNAVVAAWLALEQACESGRFQRRPADSPGEFVERVLASYALDAGAIRRLADLYREARFSTHPVTEASRAEAAACLDRLLTGLPARSPGGRP